MKAPKAWSVVGAVGGLVVGGACGMPAAFAAERLALAAPRPVSTPRGATVAACLTWAAGGLLGAAVGAVAGAATGRVLDRDPEP